MSGAGMQNNLSGNRLTPRVAVRTVDAVDASIDAVSEIIDTRLNEGGTSVTRGDHTTLALFVKLFNCATAATLRLFAHGVVEEDEESSSSSSSSPDDCADSDWFLVEEFAVTADNLLQIYVDLPAGEYKVMVTGITGGTGTRVIVREQHSS